MAETRLYNQRYCHESHRIFLYLPEVDFFILKTLLIAKIKAKFSKVFYLWKNSYLDVGPGVR